MKLLPPDEIVIAASNKADFPNREGGPYVHLLARMSYVNEGSVGYNATIKRERIQFSIAGGLQFEESWYRFVTADAAGSDGATLVVSKISDFHPFGLSSGSSESHMTLFQPWPKTCSNADKDCKWDTNYILWDTFSKAIKPSQQAKIRLLADEFGTEVPAVADCTVTINGQSFANIQRANWDAPVCR